jgi:glucosamine--fructose-6-phosphate aminotransferase (isomerizing)
MSLLALQLLAIRIAEVRGRMTMDQASALRSRLAASAGAIEQTLAAVDEPCRQLARQWKDFDNFEFIGSGPNYGMAAYGAAKVLEAVGRHAVHEDTEEWNHLHYFVARSQATGTLLLAHRPARSFSRTAEVAGYLTTLRRPYVVLSDSARPFGDQAMQTLSVQWPFDEALAPIVYCVPLALFAAYLHEANAATDRRDTDERWRDSRGGAAVRDSFIDMPGAESPAQHPPT